jgi:putative transposase
MAKSFGHRRSIRLPDYNYSQNGAYFVTICSYQRNSIFGEINEGQISLSKIGDIAQKCLQEIPGHYPQVTLLDSVIMPDHIHVVIGIQNDDDIDDNINEIKEGATCCAPTMNRNNKIAAGSLGAIVRSYKGAVSKLVNTESSSSPIKLWQRGFYERLIRDEKELNKAITYIDMNPLNWRRAEE